MTSIPEWLKTDHPREVIETALPHVVGNRVEAECAGPQVAVSVSDQGRGVPPEMLRRQVWSGRAAGDTELVRNFVKKLRRKLGEDAARPTWIFNVRAVGYRVPRPGGP